MGDQSACIEQTDLPGGDPQLAPNHSSRLVPPFPLST
eukprot:gene14422-biopygen16823